MAEIIMTVFAILFIIALVGLIIAVLSTVGAVQGIIASGKGAVTMIDKPKDAGIRLVNNGKRIAFKLRDRALVIADHAKASAESVSAIKHDLTIVADAIKNA